MRHAQAPFDPVTVQGPRAEPLPLVCDSPHSGTTYPADFAPALDAELLRSGEDTHVHELWQAVPDVGGTLLHAEFPRSYIDPNREADDIDPDLLDGAWPGALRPTEKSRLGHGLIWRSARGQPIYDRQLGVREVQQRIERYHQPYHDALAREIAAAYRRFGMVWHLNLHSMPADSYASLQIDSDRPLADFVLGDRDGTTCDPGLVDTVERALLARGYSVARNDPFKGVALISRLGRPAEGRHSLQIEIHRGLYMDEATREKSAGFAALQSALAEVSAELALYIRNQL